MSTANQADRSFWRAYGPGILFAGAAVGVSHLVQSTRAGAGFGLGLLGFVVLANVFKYPAFRFGPHYAAATGTSLLEGYRRQGRWALWLFAALTVATMFTVEAAVTIVTAGVAIALFGLDTTPLAVSVALLGACAGIIAAGRFHYLDRISKVVVPVLTVTTLAATVLALPRIEWGNVSLWPETFDAATIAVVVALVGWMPSAIDVSVWSSLWTIARRHDTGYAPTVSECTLDFHIGYLGTAVLAVCFVLLGAGVMHGSGATFAAGAGPFAAQVMALYTDTIGPWSRPIIGAAALSVMFSTTLTVVDGFPRVIAVLAARLRAPERADIVEDDAENHRRTYWLALAVLAAGSLVVIGALLTSLKLLVDVATTLSFLTAPALAVLNHRSVTGPEVPTESRPAPWLVALSWAGIVFMSALALCYLYVRFGV